MAIAPYKGLLKHQHNLFSALRNFLTQARPYLFVTHGGEVGGALSRRILEAFAQAKGLRLVEPRLVMHNLLDVAVHLPALQAEFRRLFAARTSTAELARLEQQERKEMEAVLTLWHAYQRHPEVYRDNPTSWAGALWELPIREVLRRIEQGFHVWEKDGIRAKVMSRPDRWEGEGALWLRIDSDDPLQFWIVPQQVKALLREAVADVLNDSRHRYIVEHRWKAVVILSLVRGRSIGRWAWKIALYNLSGRDEDANLSWVDNVPRLIDDELWRLTGLATWDSPALREAHVLLMAAGRMRAMMAHLQDWLPLTHVDGADIEVVQAFADRHSPEWSAVVQSLLDGIEALARQFNNLDTEERQARPYLVAAVKILPEHFAHWFPDTILSGTGEPLSISAIEQWQADWAAHEEALFHTCALYLADATGG